MDKVLTIIVPAYNVEAYITKNIESILSCEQIDSIEVLIIDDGSKDHTYQLAIDYEKSNSKCIRIISKENGGHGSAINKGVQFATGKYLKVIDGDDWVDAVELAKLVAFLEISSADIVVNPYKIVYEQSKTEQIICLNGVEEKKEFLVGNSINMFQEIYGIHSVTYRTEMYKSCVNEITEKCFYVDQEYNLYPLVGATTIAYHSANVYRYRLGRAGQSVNMASKIRNNSMHVAVIHNLMSFLERTTFEGEKRKFCAERIIKMLNVQMIIYMCRKDSRVAYYEMRNFRNFYLSVFAYETLFGLSKAIGRFPLLFWGLRLGYRTKYRKDISSV